jgi:putative nucleotidyltransferase with HDIG domain
MTPEALKELLDAIEAKDLCTAAHTWRVVLYSRAMAEDAGVPPEMVERITRAAALHDVGKLDVPEPILQKPGRLTPEEFEVIKTHVTVGAMILEPVRFPWPVIPIVMSHHERWDGRGYPDGLAGERIAPAARYFTVIDCFDAMTTVRPYRREVGPGAVRTALAELEAGSGTHYWPRAVEMFTRLHRTGALAWITEHFNDTCPVEYDGGHTLAEVSRTRARV